MDVRQLSDWCEIQALKGRYFRLMDTKQWELFRNLFTDDFRFFFDNSPLPRSTTPTLDSATAMTEYMARGHPDKVTVHHGHTPEIRFVDEDTAEGIWALSYYVDDPDRGVAAQADGHYHDRFVRFPDGQWRIAEIHLTHLRTTPVRPPMSDGRPSSGGAGRAGDEQATPE